MDSLWQAQEAVTGDITFASTNSSGANFQDGSKIKPGDTATNYGIGKIEVTGAGTWNTGTTYQWEINDLTGDAGDANGDGFGWDYLTFSGAPLQLLEMPTTRFF